MNAPYITTVRLKEENPLDATAFPGNLPFLKDLNVTIDAPVTFFVGENGSGKSTLLEALAVVANLPIAGGGTNELGANHAFHEESLLATSIRVAFARQPKDRYFFRAETQGHLASLLENREDDPDFLLPGGARANPYTRYGGQSLHKMSHGEAFLSIMNNRFNSGLFLMDEPESALSPQRQLTLLALMHRLVSTGSSQFIAATHSPILLTFPGAAIVSFDDGALTRIRLEETSHFQITKSLLNNPAMYWRHLATPE
ncbi:AAA family ATPase [Pirellulaceae bacterium SH501]